MKLKLVFVLGSLFGVAVVIIGQRFELPTTHTHSRDMESINVFFSPKGGCAKAVVDAIGSAKTSVYFQAYSFTNEDISKALIDAHKRGVDVHGLMDKSDAKEKSCLDELLTAGIDVLIDSKHAIAHNKIMIIDGSVVVTGSFNFTNQAEHANAENLLVIRNPALAVLYTANWNIHKEHSKPK